MAINTFLVDFKRGIISNSHILQPKVIQRKREMKYFDDSKLVKKGGQKKCR